MPVSLPNPLTDGTTAFGSQVRTNDDTIAAKFTEGTNGISDADIAAAAAIKGTKLSSVAGNRVPTDRIEDDAVTDAKLRDDAVTDANRAVTRNHIRNAAVDKTKVSTVAGESLSKAQLDITIRSVPFSIGALGANKRYIAASVVSGVVAGDHSATILWVTDDSTLLETSVQGGSTIVTPAAPNITVAANTLLAVYLDQVTGYRVDNTALAGNVVFVHIKTT